MVKIMSVNGTIELTGTWKATGQGQTSIKATYESSDLPNSTTPGTIDLSKVLSGSFTLATPCTGEVAVLKAVDEDITVEIPKSDLFKHGAVKFTPTIQVIPRLTEM